MAKPRIAMLGGTFDPVHIGHLRSAIELQEQLLLDRVHMVVNRQPPHRQSPGVEAADRLNLLETAVANLPGIEADDRELKRAGPSYSIDTLRSLRAQYGNTACLMMVIGADAAASLDQWHEPLRLFDYAHIVIIARPGEQRTLPVRVRKLLHGREVALQETLFDMPCGRYVSLTLPTPIAVSATAIRERLQQGRSVRYLLPECVERAIQARRLYAK